MSSVLASCSFCCVSFQSCINLMLCHLARLCCLIQVSYSLVLLFSQSVGKSYNWPPFQGGKACYVRETGHHKSLICPFGSILRFWERPDAKPDAASASGCDIVLWHGIKERPISSNSCSKSWAQKRLISLYASWFLHLAYIHAQICKCTSYCFDRYSKVCSTGRGLHTHAPCYCYTSLWGGVVGDALLHRFLEGICVKVVLVGGSGGHHVRTIIEGQQSSSRLTVVNA